MIDLLCSGLRIIDSPNMCSTQHDINFADIKLVSVSIPIQRPDRSYTVIGSWIFLRCGWC